MVKQKFWCVWASLWLTGGGSGGSAGAASLADPDDGKEGDHPLEPKNDYGVTPLGKSGTDNINVMFLS